MAVESATIPGLLVLAALEFVLDRHASVRLTQAILDRKAGDAMTARCGSARDAGGFPAVVRKIELWKRRSA